MQTAAFCARHRASKDCSRTLTGSQKSQARPASRSPARCAVATEDRIERTPASGVILERTGRRVKRYPLDGSSPSESEDTPDSDEPQGSVKEQALDALKGFALPRGWPDSVTADYLPYQLWTIPSHIFGWVSVSLATSSLLKALGASPGPAGAAASAAAIKWITKDGIGAAGRLLVGGRLAGVFDEDPRRWRLIAEGFATLGQGLEIATAFQPGLFVALAGAGNFAKAVGKGLGKPCFRIIQVHFALQNNVGDISAKEEVWEVTAQLAGLAFSVGLLKSIEASYIPALVLPAWGASQVLHIAMRFQSLRQLRFDFLNQKRACGAVHAYVRGQQVPSVQQANDDEPMIQPPDWVQPSVNLDCSLEEALLHLPSSFTNSSAEASHAASTSASTQLPHAENRSPEQQHSTQLAALAHVYQQHRHMLVWGGGKGWGLLHTEAAQHDVLKLLLQAAWLEQQGIQDAASQDLSRSCQFAHDRFKDFAHALEKQRWNMDATGIRSGTTRLQW